MCKIVSSSRQINPTENSTFFWRLLPSQRNCSVSSAPSTPSRIKTEDALISNFSITPRGGLTLAVAWEPPRATYGRVERYEVILASSPVEGDQESVEGLEDVLNSTQVDVS